MTDTERIARLEHVLAVLIVWVSSAAGSPISHQEAQILLRKLEEEPPAGPAPGTLAHTFWKESNQ